MSKLMSLARRAPKRFSAIVAMVAAAIIVPMAVNAWGPARETFTIEKPASHVAFNSITNNPNIGDERNFVGIREVGSENKWYDNVTAQPNKEYYVRMYVHNNAAANLNLTAKDVTAKFNLPTTTGKSVQVAGFLSTSNAGADKAGNPGKFAEVYDTANFTSDKNFNVAYIAGSLKYENNAFGAAGAKLPESIFTNAGTKLGYDKLDGNIPGCFKYAGYVTFKVKAQFAENLDFTLTKKVSKHGANQWSDSYAAQPGETVDFLLNYKNTGAAVNDDVTFRDTLPTGLSYVAKSGKWNNASKQNIAFTNDAALTNGTGVNVGSYAKGANAYIVFSAKVADKAALQCGLNTLTNKAKVTTEGYSVEDTATVTVTKDCPKPVAKYTCDALKVTKVDRTNFKFETSYTAQNATFKSVTYTIKNAAGTTVDTKTVNGTTYLAYAQTTPGKYTVQAVASFTVDGVVKTAPVGNCKGEFEVAKPPVVVKDITVCELATKKIITIKETAFDSSKHSKNLDDCKEVVVKDITVCELSTKEIITIKETAFDSSKHSKNLDDCKEVVPPVTPPVTPPELPQTGAGENIVAIVGLGALVASLGYYIASRRALS